MPDKFLHMEALRRILTPINVSRCYEFSRTFDCLRPEKGDLILDLSSPKLLSVYIKEKVGCRVVTSDINIDEIRDWKSLTDHKKAKPEWLLIDGQNTGFRNNSFDKVFSISVLEHIAGDGDAKTVKELGRILKPGGRLVFTVPFSLKYREESRREDVYDLYTEEQKDFHWSHYYDEDTIREKLVRDSGLVLENMYFGYGTGSLIWKRIERLGRYGFPFWFFSMFLAGFGLKESAKQPPALTDDHCLVMVVVLTKEENTHDQ
ncbi:MAG TPA: class I SAM-dependent methyltransferase [Nitrospirae bacterium]|nr:hypothetical protein BMS3Abin06_02848 [bacterium BMS3Abin06]HDH12905.1 class I SAM-dependent methyltransferase [Nitrospirota bacterium]HDZ01683.1 class I SAM-dependent methyltransferase [Nitrospirota bacterium]